MNLSEIRKSPRWTSMGLLGIGLLYAAIQEYLVASSGLGRPIVPPNVLGILLVSYVVGLGVLYFLEA